MTWKQIMLNKQNDILTFKNSLLIFKLFEMKLKSNQYKTIKNNKNNSLKMILNCHIQGQEVQT